MVGKGQRRHSYVHAHAVDPSNDVNSQPKTRILYKKMLVLFCPLTNDKKNALEII